MAQSNIQSQRLNHEYIGTEHILLGLVVGNHPVGEAIFSRLGIALGDVAREVEQQLDRAAIFDEVERRAATSRAKRVIERAIEEADNTNHGKVDAEMLLLALLREPDGIAAQVLDDLGLEYEKAHTAALDLLA